MTSYLFLAFSALWSGLLVWRIQRYSGNRTATDVLLGLTIWLIYVITLAKTGILNSMSMPPRLLFLLVPILVFAIWLVRSSASKAVAEKFPLRELIGLQAFRIGVEVFLNQLRKEELLPSTMTFHGQNFDIIIGISALILYLAWNRIPNQTTVIRYWNFLGLALLTNVVVTGILSTPGPLQLINREHPNLAITQFPYVFIPGLFVLSALGLHILALKNLGAQSGK